MFSYNIKLKLYTRLIDGDSLGDATKNSKQKAPDSTPLFSLTIVIKHLTLSRNEIVPLVRECIPKISPERVRRKY